MTDHRRDKRVLLPRTSSRLTKDLSTIEGMLEVARLIEKLQNGGNAAKPITR
jgi:hypothetical protein